MTIFEMLKKDHRAAEKLLLLLDKTVRESKQRREGYLNKLETIMALHSKAEEDIFYAALKDKPETQELVHRAMEVHQSIERLLGELHQLLPHDQAWETQVASLKTNILKHIRDEEYELFPRAKALLDAPTLKSMPGMMKAARSKALAHPTQQIESLHPEQREAQNPDHYSQAV
jgi:hemerythrin superfamily protein